MQRIETLLQKISELAAKGEKNSVIDIDLMLDYVKVVYADLLELRGRVTFTSSLPSAENEPASVVSPVAETAPEEEPAAVVAPIPESAPEPGAEEPLPSHPEPVPPPVTVQKEEMLPPVEDEAIKPPFTQYVPPKTYDIRTIIGINDKYLFISELFGNDKETYESTLDEINKKESHKEALEWMSENVLFVNDGNDEDNGTGQLFYDTLNTFFSER